MATRLAAQDESSFKEGKEMKMTARLHHPSSQVRGD